MHVIDAIPIARGARTGALSYFTADAPPLGSVLSVPVRGKLTPALVTGVRDASELKATLRSSRFPLKRANGKSARRIFSDAFVQAVGDIARFHAAHTGETLFALAPQIVLENAKTLEEALPTRRSSDIASERLILQAPRSERIGTYKSIIRESFAREKSVFVLVPNIQDGEALFAELGKGIEKRVLLLHTGVPKKKLLAAWNRVALARSPLLIIATGSFLSLPLHALGTLIIERESSGSYVTQTRPYVNIRLAAVRIARELSARLIIGDFPLRVETIYECKEGTGVCEELAPLKVRAPLAVSYETLDMRKSPTNEVKRFTAISDALAGAIARVRVEGGRSFIFAARRGLSALTVCNDCGTPVTDTETGAPMVLHKSAQGNVFISHASGIVKPSGIRCTTCDGWNLVSLGVGIQRVEDEIRARFPDAPVITIDRDSVKTHAEAKNASERFYKERGSILIGTEMAIPYVSEQVQLTAVASLDSLLALPEWRAHERTFGVLMQLRERAKEIMLVQTRHPDHPVINFAKEGDVMGFYRKELEDRRDFDYPPFSIFIALSWQGTKSAVEHMRTDIKKIFEGHELLAHIPALHATPVGKSASQKDLWRARALLRLQRGAWPDEKLLALLAALPPAIAVHVDPQELL